MNNLIVGGTDMNNFEQVVDLFSQKMDIKGYTQNFQDLLDRAAQSKETFALFMNRYAFFNGQIASSITGLSSHVSGMEGVFLDPDTRLPREADLRFRIGQEVLAAAIDEYGDPNFLDVKTGDFVPHRELAEGVSKYMAEYAGWDEKTRASIVEPAWMRTFSNKIRRVYRGEDISSGKDKTELTENLFKALGAHLFSELSADESEFPNVQKTIRTNPDLMAHLKANPTVKLRDMEFDAVGWMKTHGGDFDKGESHGVEFVHLNHATKALAMALSCVPEDKREKWLGYAIKGAQEFADLLGGYFKHMKKEIDLIMPIANNNDKILLIKKLEESAQTGGGTPNDSQVKWSPGFDRGMVI